MKSPPAKLGNPRHTLGPLQWLPLLPAFIMSLAAQPVLTPMDNGVMWEASIVWPDTIQGYIAVSTTDADNGPWVPSLEPIAWGRGYCRLPVQAKDSARFFRLAEGTWFMDDFDDGALDDGWTTYFFSPEFENNITLDPAGGRLRVSGNCGSCTSRSVYIIREGVLTADCNTSIDLLDWDDNPSNRQNIFLVSRVEPGVITTNTAHYLGGVSPRFSENPEQSVLWMGTLIDGEFNYIGEWQPIPKILPSNDYRLVFSLVDRTGTLELYDLADLEAPLHTVVREYTGQFPVSSGWAGFAVSENNTPPGTLNVTVDNIATSATSPGPDTRRRQHTP